MCKKVNSPTLINPYNFKQLLYIVACTIRLQMLPWSSTHAPNNLGSKLSWNVIFFKEKLSNSLDFDIASYCNHICISAVPFRNTLSSTASARQAPCDRESFLARKTPNTKPQTQARKLVRTVSFRIHVVLFFNIIK